MATNKPERPEPINYATLFHNTMERAKDAIHAAWRGGREEGLAECQAAHEAERASFEARELKALRERDALRTQVAELVAALEDIESYNVQGLSMTAHIALRNYRAAMPKEQE